MLSACEQIKISALKQKVPYPIEIAERVQTKYGETVLATLRAESPQTFLKVFLPRRYGVLFSDEELQRINEKTVSLSLKYQGTNTTTNSYIWKWNRYSCEFPDGTRTRRYGTVFRILQIPRRCHKQFRNFCIKIKEKRVKNVYLAFAGRTDNGEPVLEVSGGEFHAYMC